MKRITLLLAIAAVAIALTAPGARAIGVYGIYWNPKSDTASDGLGGGVRFDSQVSPMVTIDARFSYVVFDDDPNNLSVMPIEMTARFGIGKMLYGGGGVGYYKFGGNVDVGSEFGWYLLAGISVLPGQVSFFGEFKWQILEPGNGVDLEAFVYHLGITFPTHRSY